MALSLMLRTSSIILSAFFFFSFRTVSVPRPLLSTFMLMGTGSLIPSPLFPSPEPSLKPILESRANPLLFLSIGVAKDSFRDGLIFLVLFEESASSFRFCNSFCLAVLELNTSPGRISDLKQRFFL